jgi:endonuclease/exonuclease/phosphatase family metal-dependent hydrolase
MPSLLDLLALPAVPLAAALLPWAAHHPAPIESVAPLRPAARQPLSRGDTVRVLSWNIQFCGSRREAFFYDGGPRVHVPPEDVEESLQGIVAALTDIAPTITLLQEVDRNAQRTGRRDQLRALLDELPPQSSASATYWRSPFVPSPVKTPLGRVDMHLATLSSHGIAAASRQQLALLKEPRWRQRFNLKRALLTVDIPLTGGGSLALANTHLSAFSYGDGTLDEQVEALAAWMDSHPPDRPWILAGDLNLLPPDDEPARLGLSRPLFSAPQDNPLRRLIPRFKSAFPTRGAETYLPHGSPEADRTIDYIFYGGPLTLTSASVKRRYNAVSDHLPLVAELKLSGPPGGRSSS